MTKDRNFRVINGGEAASDENGTEPDVALALVLMKGFRLLSRENKLRVIQIVDKLSSSRLPDKQ